MTVHINGSKGKELYYNGVKIKEAYYNGNKVYSSGPLYYCYKDRPFGGCYYLKIKPTTSGTYTMYWRNNAVAASQSSELINSGSFSLTDVTSTSFVLNTFTYDYYPSGDLYT